MKTPSTSQLRLSISDAAREFGISRQTIHRALKAPGAPLPDYAGAYDFRELKQHLWSWAPYAMEGK